MATATVDVISQTERCLGIQRGNGDGTFRGPEQFCTNDTYHAVAVADVDRDGIVEILVLLDSDSAPGTYVGLWRNDHGVFNRSLQSRSISPQARALTVADIDGDGDLDAIAAGGRTLTILRAPDFAQVEEPITISLDSVATQIAAGDVTGDGIEDLIVDQAHASDAKLAVLRGLGGGGFVHAVSFPIADRTLFGIRAVDVSEDGRKDIVASLGNGDHGGLMVIRSSTRSPSGFDDPFETSASAGGKFVLAPIDWDSLPDLVSLASRSLLIGPGTGDGHFGNDLRSPTLPGATGVILVDVNGDRILDVVTTGDSAGFRYVASHVGDGSGCFAPPTRSVIDGSLFAVTDVNGDGRADALSRWIDCRNGDSRISVLLADPSGAFGTRRGFHVPECMSSTVVADANNDGWQDVVFTSLDRYIVVYAGNGDGTFGLNASSEHHLNPFVGAYLQCADLDHDGRMDAVVTDGSDVEVLRGVGLGAFLPVNRYSGEGYGVLEELNGDDDIDMLAGDPTWFLRPGDGRAGFGPPQQEVQFGGFPRDFDGDGDIDLAAGYSQTISLTEGLGSGVFVKYRYDGRDRYTIAEPGASRSAVGDVNGDSMPDFVIATRSCGTLTTFLNRNCASPPIVWQSIEHRANDLRLFWQRRPGDEPPAVESRGPHDTDWRERGLAQIDLHERWMFADYEAPEDQLRFYRLVPRSGTCLSPTAPISATRSPVPRIDYRLEGRPTGIVTADLDENEQLDVLTMDQAGALTLLLRRAGTFSPPVRISTLGNPRSLSE